MTKSAHRRCGNHLVLRIRRVESRSRPATARSRPACQALVMTSPLRLQYAPRNLFRHQIDLTNAPASLRNCPSPKKVPPNAGSECGVVRIIEAMLGHRSGAAAGPLTTARVDASCRSPRTLWSRFYHELHVVHVAHRNLEFRSELHRLLFESCTLLRETAMCSFFDLKNDGSVLLSILSVPFEGIRRQRGHREVKLGCVKL